MPCREYELSGPFIWVLPAQTRPCPQCVHSLCSFILTIPSYQPTNGKRPFLWLRHSHCHPFCLSKRIENVCLAAARSQLVRDHGQIPCGQFCRRPLPSLSPARRGAAGDIRKFTLKQVRHESLIEMILLYHSPVSSVGQSVPTF